MVPIPKYFICFLGFQFKLNSNANNKYKLLIPVHAKSITIIKPDSTYNAGDIVKPLLIVSNNTLLTPKSFNKLLAIEAINFCKSYHDESMITRIGKDKISNLAMNTNNLVFVFFVCDFVDFFRVFLANTFHLTKFFNTSIE